MLPPLGGSLTWHSLAGCSMCTISAWRAYKAWSSFCSSHRYLCSRLALLLMCCASTLYELSPETRSNNSQAILPNCYQENETLQLLGNTLANFIPLTNNGWLTNRCHQCSQELVGCSLCFVQVSLQKNKNKNSWFCMNHWKSGEHQGIDVTPQPSRWCAGCWPGPAAVCPAAWWAPHQTWPSC